MIPRPALAVVLLVIAGCGDISRIEPEPAPAAPSVEPSPMPIRPAPPASPTRADGGDPRPAPEFSGNTDPLEGAIQSQVWRMQQQETAIARIPPTEPVPAAEVDALRQQRVQAQSMAAAQAGSAALTRPTLGSGSGRPDFSYPAPAVSPQLGRAINQARAAETSALTR